MTYRSHLFSEESLIHMPILLEIFFFLAKFNGPKSSVYEALPLLRDTRGLRHSHESTPDIRPL
jgi:hypothetical protein